MILTLLWTILTAIQRLDSSKKPRNGVKKSKPSEGRARVQKADFSDDNHSESGSDHQDRQQEDMYSESDDERLAGVGEEGVDLSELMDMDDTPVTEPDSNRPTAEHKNMLKTLRKGLGLDYAAQRAKAREEVRSIAPAKKENAFGVNAEGAAKVDLSDLMASSTFSKETKKGLEKLERSDRRLDSEQSKYAKARSERAVAYEDTKAILSEWLPTVQSMRQTDNLVFPLPEQVPKRERPTTSGATTSFEPTTDLEKTIFGLLDESGVTEARLQEAEDLATKKLSPAELKARHQQIARLRSLYFYQEQKNKRQAKIKSKKYRKILKKAKEKNELTLAELKELDPEAYEAELEKMDKARALERVGIKHAHLGKWAKHALRSKDPHTMQAVRDHLDHGRRLRKKMTTDRDGSDDDSDIDSDISSIHSSDLESDSDELDIEDEDAGEPGDIIDIHGNIVKPKKKKASAEEGDEEAESGIFGMKFMQRATAKKQSDHDELMDEMDQEIEERKRKLRVQRQKAKDDFTESGLKAESDSEDDGKTSSSRSRKAAEMEIDSEDDEDAAAGPLETSTRSGRRSVKSTPAQVNAAALARQSFYNSDDEDGLDGNTMALDRPQGFSATLKGQITVQAKTRKSAPSHTQADDSDASSANGDEAASESEDDRVHAFNANAKNVKDALQSKTPAPLTKAAKKAAAAAAKKSEAASKASTQKSSSGDSINEDGVLIGASFTSGSKTSKHIKKDLDEDVDEEETVISFSKTSKASAQSSAPSASQKAVKVEAEEDNPWMMVNEDDEGLVIPGTVAPGGNSKSPAAASKAAKRAAAKAKKNEDRVAVDLGKVQKKLEEEEARRDGVVFNLSAAGATSKAQRELIERAFAADHVTEKDFAVEKESMVEAANEVEEEYATLTMPGWGEWAGNGTRPSQRRQRLLKEMEDKKTKRSAELMAQRKDSRLKHVVLNEDKNKHFALYQAASVPFEFKDNAALYESSLRQPMGKEWNVRDTHAKLVKPKVIVRPGHVIQPIQKKKEGIQRR